MILKLIISLYVFVALNTQISIGQNANAQPKFTVIKHQNINLSYKNINELLVINTIPAAIEIQVPSSSSSVEIFASIIFIKSSEHQTIGLKLNSNNSNNVALINTNETVLGTTPVKLLSISSSFLQLYTSYFFDVVIHGIYKHIEPDNYLFNINFSDKE